MFGMKERIASLMLEVGELRDALRLANNESADALRNLIQAGEVIKTLRIRLETLMY